MDLRYSSINNTGFTISIRLAGFFIAKVQTAFKITDSQTITFEMQMNIKRKKWLVNIDRYISGQNASDLPFVMTYRQGGDRRSKVDGSSTLLGLTNFLKSKKDLPHHDHAMLFTE